MYIYLFVLADIDTNNIQYLYFINNILKYVYSSLICEICDCSVTRERREVVLQGLASNGSWLEYEFKCKPGAVDRLPCVITPYHYRLDWLMWFAAMQVSDQQRTVMRSTAAYRSRTPQQRASHAPHSSVQVTHPTVVYRSRTPQQRAGHAPQNSIQVTHPTPAYMSRTPQQRPGHAPHSSVQVMYPTAAYRSRTPQQRTGHAPHSSVQVTHRAYDECTVLALVRIYSRVHLKCRIKRAHICIIIIIIIIIIIGSGGEPAGGVGCCARGLGLGCDASCRRWGSPTPAKVKNLLPPEPPHVS